MGFGLGVLKLSPEAFWRMTLPELAAIVDVMVPIRNVPDRHVLRELMGRYPDRGGGAEVPIPSRGREGDRHGKRI